MSDKKKKPQKLKARLPRGFGDRQAGDIRATDEMMAKIKGVYERYGFDPVETPMFEYTDALGKFLPDSDRPNEGVFSLTDDDDQWMSLRYDLTAPLARHVAENFNDIQLPYRTYRAGWVFRNEKPGPGRFRQFMQFDADTVGAPGVQADAEMCMMMADVMEALGLKGQYVIRVNNRKVLDGVLEAIGLGGDEKAERRLTVLRAIDKLDKFGVEGVRRLLGAGRWDGGKEGEGDFTKGAGLDDEQISSVVRLLDDQNILNSLGGSDPNNIDLWSLSDLATNTDVRNGLSELGAISEICQISGYDETRIRIDPSCVRGLEYYTGPVFEAELLAEIPNEKGEIVRFGSVGGGGRYDGLVSRFMGQPVPATGFSIGVSRLMTALKNLGKLGQDDVLAPVLVTVMDKDIDSLGRYQRFTQALRAAGIRAEMFQGNPKDFGKQLKYADRRGCPIAIIQGGDERAKGIVQIKDLIEGKRAAEGIEDNAAWREARVAQYEVSEDDIVAKVRDILAAQSEDRARDER
jgi:histidyl-tRNA synthetase